MTIAKRQFQRTDSSIFSGNALQTGARWCNRGERLSPKYFVRGRRSPNDIRTRATVIHTVAFPEAGLQRNAKFIVS